MKTPKMTLEIKRFFREAGSRGGKKASASMTQEQRTKRARKAGKARQAKKMQRER
jgi:predicted transposase YdaD